MKIDFLTCLNTSYEIIKRQTTYIEFIDNESNKKYVIKYLNKKEYKIEVLHFEKIDICLEHPLLEDYNSPNVMLYISSPVEAVKINKVEKHLIESINMYYKGWRSYKDYFNIQYGIQNVLQGGIGLLYKGPLSSAITVKKILSSYSIKFSQKDCKLNNSPRCKILLMGDNYVIAEDFHIEKLNHCPHH